MTAFALKLADATFASARRGIRLPNRRKLVLECVLGISQAESVKNRADPTRPMTVQGGGSILYNGDHAVVRSHAATGFGFKTGLIPADDATLIVVRRNSALATEPHIVGSVDGIRKMGFRQSAATNYFSNGEVSQIGASRAKPADGTAFFEAGVFSRQNPQRATGGIGKLYYFNLGVQVLANAPENNTTSRESIPEICIGTTSLSDTINNNSTPVYFVALYQRTLTAAEIDEAFADIKAYYQTRGVTVI